MAPRAGAAQSRDHPLLLSTWHSAELHLVTPPEKQGWWLSSLEQEEWERPVAGRQSIVIVSGSSTVLQSHHCPWENGDSLSTPQNLPRTPSCLSYCPTNFKVSTLTWYSKKGHLTCANGLIKELSALLGAREPTAQNKILITLGSSQ